MKSHITLASLVALSFGVLFVLPYYVHAAPITQTLGVGAAGTQVTQLQNELQQLGYYQGPVSGSFDYSTQAALEAFQKANSLYQSGYTDTQTRVFLSNVGSTTPATAISTSTVSATTTSGLGGAVISASSTVSNTSAGTASTGLVKITANMTPAQVRAILLAELQTLEAELAAILARQGSTTSTSTGTTGAVTSTGPGISALTPVVSGGTTSTPTNNGTSVVLLTINLTPGASGPQVTQLQQALLNLGYLSTPPTGYYGAATKKAVAAYQAANGLPAVGNAGPRTRQLINVYLQSLSVSTSNPSTPTIVPIPPSDVTSSSTDTTPLPTSPTAPSNPGDTSGGSTGTGFGDGSGGSGGGGGGGSSAQSTTPTATLSLNDSSITSGGSTTLTWSSTNATSCTGTGFVTGNQTGGSVTVSPTINTTYSVSCTDANNNSASQSASLTVSSVPVVTPPVVTPAPTVSLTATPSSIVSGATAKLTWTSTGATTCTPSGFVGVGTSGNTNVSPTATTTYSIACLGTGGTAAATTTVSVTKPVVVTPAPTVTFTATPSSITSGATAQLAWSSTNATSCTPTGFTGSGISGTANVSPTTTTTYSISCTGTGGTKASSATVTVTSAPVVTPPVVTPPATGAPTVTLTAATPTVADGATDMLTWSSTGATSCTSSRFYINSQLSGSIAVMPTATADYGVTCTNSKGSTTQKVTVTLQQPLLISPAVDMGTYSSWDSSKQGTPVDLTGFHATFSEDFNNQSDITANGGSGPIYAPIHSSLSVGYDDTPGDSAHPNYIVKNGYAILRFYKDSNGSWHAGTMQTADKNGTSYSTDTNDNAGLLRYGYFESRIRFPSTAVAYWAGTWLLAPQNTNGHVEIDNIEWYGEDMQHLHGTVHNWSTPYSKDGNLFNLGNAIDDGKWHTYGVMKEPNLIILYMDRKEVGRVKVPDNFNVPVYSLVSLIVNGNDQQNSTPPYEEDVDYMRQYSTDPSIAPVTVDPTLAPDYATPTTVNVWTDRGQPQVGSNFTMYWSSVNATSCKSPYTSSTATSGAVTLKTPAGILAPNEVDFSVGCTGPNDSSYVSQRTRIYPVANVGVPTPTPPASPVTPPALPATPTGTLNNGLVTYWTLDSADTNFGTNAEADKSGNGNTGTLTNFTTSDVATGKVGDALSFNGANQYIVGPKTINTSKASVSVWVKYSSNPGGQEFIGGLMNGLEGYNLDKDLYLNQNGTVTWSVYDGSSHNVTSPNSITDGAWHNLVGVVDGTNAILYIDGVEVGTLPATGSQTNYTMGNVFLNGSSRYVGFSQGTEDDFRVYNRALTPVEVVELAGGQLSINDLTNMLGSVSHQNLLASVGEISGIINQLTKLLPHF